MANPKLFIFAIGGTGARVIKSLTMLLAAGIDIQASEVIPIMIDPHQTNEDLRRTLALLNNYQTIYRRLNDDNRQDFFKTKIQTLQESTDDKRLQNSFSFSLQNVDTQTFRDYIDYDNLNETDKALASLLFSEKNLNTKMDIGFVGNPNIGSVVLNQFSESKEFGYFASNFRENDRIFIISSIFGGTGAAGFPLILKNIRNVQHGEVANHAWVQKAKVGAVTVMPYFGVSPNKTTMIDKSTFISKTRAALSYYEKNVNPSLNALYYIGDTHTKDYNNDPGGGGQRNDAHFVELASALSIVDFMAIPDASLSGQPTFREFGIREDKEMLTFPMLGVPTQQLLKTRLTQYYFFVQYLKNNLNEQVNKKPSPAPFASSEPQLTSSFLTADFYRNNLSDFNQSFEIWLSEMAKNKRGFKPFELETPQYAEMIAGVLAKKSLFGGRFDHHDFTKALNETDKSLKNAASSERKLISVFFKATEKLLRDNFDYFKN